MRPYVRTAFDHRDYEGEDFRLENGCWKEINFRIPEVDGGVIEEAGLQVFSDSVNTGEASRDLGRFFVDEIRVTGEAEYRLDFAQSRVELGNLTPFAHNRGQWTLEDSAIHALCEECTQSFTGAYHTADLTLSCRSTPLSGGACLLVRGMGTLRHVLAGLTAPGKAGIWLGGPEGYRRWRGRLRLESRSAVSAESCCSGRKDGIVHRRTENRRSGSAIHPWYVRAGVVRGRESDI